MSVLKRLSNNILTDENKEIERWKQHFKEHLNAMFQQVLQQLRFQASRNSRKKFIGLKITRLLLHWIITKIWDEEYLPEDWIKGKFTELSFTNWKWVREALSKGAHALDQMFVIWQVLQ